MTENKQVLLIAFLFILTSIIFAAVFWFVGEISSFVNSGTPRGGSTIDNSNTLEAPLQRYQ